MEQHDSHLAQVDRRTFLEKVAAGGIVLPAAPAVLARRSPNDTIGVGFIGVGVRGRELLRLAQDVPGTEIRVICDLYEGNVNRARKLCRNPDVRFTREWESVITQSGIDAIFIATPDFWHAPMTIAAAEARRDIYVEKGWCKSLPEAKQMLRAVKKNNVVMQLGHQFNSLPSFHVARQLYRSGALGKVPVVRTYWDQALATPYWKWYGDFKAFDLPKDAGPKTIDWDRFIKNAPSHPFDAERFFTWRCWWDYGTGIAGDLMTHMWDGVNMIMGMGVPETVVTQGGIYFWKKRRDVPDVWHVVLDYPKQDLVICFESSSHNGNTGNAVQMLGREKTLEVTAQSCQTWLPKWKPEYGSKLAAARTLAKNKDLDPRVATVAPDYMMAPGELTVTNHVENFFACVRTRQVPRCGVDRAFQEAVTIAMSVAAFKEDRKVRWDPGNEKIV